MTVKDSLVSIIENTPVRQLSAKVKADATVYSYVIAFPGDSLSEKIYNAVNPGANVCDLGNKKKFNSITQGYRFCGRANVCSCAKESVSNKVSATKNNYSNSEKESISEKRKKTTLARHGVENTGQTAVAKKNHAAVYNDTERVANIVDGVQETKLLKYGSRFYNNPIQIKKTFKEKDTNYWSARYFDKGIEKLRDPAAMTEMFNTMSVYDIADELNVHIQTIYRYLNKHKIKQPFKSIEEKQVVDFIKSLGITNIVENSRSILPSRKEIDIFLPDFNIAIEYNGVYWHHDDVDHITRSYHHNKYKECKDQGIQLITIFSTYWKSKNDIVKKFIKNKLNQQSQRVFARKCVIKEVSSVDSKTFLATNHILGYTPASVRLGLYYNDDLVSLMTFAQKRIAIGKAETGHELVRYATSVSVVGGASKLLKAFMKQYTPEKVISYSDNEWSNGNLYRVLGFTLEKEIPPSYWYVKPREERLYHRFTFSKQKLVKKGYDPALTEKQITKQMGLLKVWDCGKLKWVLER
jgi:hypothetical protein